MKKILTVFALLVAFNFGYAQESYNKARKDVDKAVGISENPKKATKAKTWIKLAEAYANAYKVPMGNVWLGMSQQELRLIGGVEPLTTEVVELNGNSFTKLGCENINLYLSNQGDKSVVSAIEITKPVYEDALVQAANSYRKAYEVQPGKADKIVKGMYVLIEMMNQHAYSLYSIGDMEGALKYFAGAVDLAYNEPVNRLDTAMVYNVGFIATSLKKNDIAKKYLTICKDNDYYGSDGEVFAKLAFVDEENAESYLKEGFSKFPESQSVLFGMINYYIGQDGQSDKLFELLDDAKKADPKNPSIYSVEGDVWLRMNDIDKAVAAYRRSIEVDPEYALGYLQLGCTLYNNAIDIVRKADSEFDDQKYNEMCEEAERIMKQAIDPLEKGFDLAEGENKLVAARNLKSLFFVLREESQEYMDNYEKYDAFVKENE